MINPHNLQGPVASHFKIYKGVSSSNRPRVGVNVRLVQLGEGLQRVHFGGILVPGRLEVHEGANVAEQ